MSGSDWTLANILAANPDLAGLNPGLAGQGKKPALPARQGGELEAGGVSMPAGATKPSESQKTGRSKYRNIPTVYRGRTYASRREARYAAECDLRVAGGELVAWCPQVTFPLPGGIRYVADFVELLHDWTFRVVDAKGHKTREYKMKAKLFRAKYGQEIIEV